MNPPDAIAVSGADTLRDGGYVAAVILLALMAPPAVMGTALGVRARHPGEHRLGTTALIVNAVIATYLVFTVAATLVLG